MTSTTLRKTSLLNRCYSAFNFALAVFCAALVVIGIALYSETVSLKGQARGLSRSIEDLKASIASDQNDLYLMTDFGELESFVDQLSLVREYNLEYLRLDGDQLSLR
ncbi:MAG: hypothetical protein R3B52_03235 [Candidatus Paceibacterota bacterium]